MKLPGPRRRRLGLLAAAAFSGLLASTVLAAAGLPAGAAPSPTAKPALAKTSAKLRITTTSLPPAERAAPYRATLEATAGRGPYRWRATSPLPQGLRLRPDGTIDGRATWRAVSETFAVVVSDVRHPGSATAATFTLSVTGQLPTTAAVSAHLLHPCAAASRVLCGAVRVPLYWSAPDGPKLTVRFRLYPHLDQSLPPLEPIVAMEGGPGLPSIGSAASYLLMIGSLAERHDLIVMDNRGTGISSVIKCPALQHYFGFAQPGDLVQLVAGCQNQLGEAANAYGTDAVGDDLADILGQLGITTVDVYGDSYGDYSAQVFTLHHPSLVRTLVLDGSYNNEYNPFEMEDTGAMRRAWTLLCDRSGNCSDRTILKQIAAFALHLQTDPITGMAANYSGRRIHVDLTAAAFAQLVYDATYTYTEFDDLPAALRAFAAGDKAPLLRLAAEDVEQNTSGWPAGSSVGDFEAVSCHDYPSVWQTSASDAERQAQLASAIAKLPPNVFYPFTKATYLASYDENSLVYGCLDWQAPTTPDPPFPSNIPYPHTPVLIFDGQFDQATPVFDTRKVIRSWPNVTFVEVSNSNHVTADYDFQNCTSVILQRFIQTLAAGDTSCASAMPPVSVVPAFPVKLAAAPAATAAGGASNTLIGRQAAWTTAQTLGDALTRWFNLSYGNGFGLYGGSFKAHGVFFASGPMTLSLDQCRFVKDLAVSGTVTWNRSTGVVDASVTVQGPGQVSGSFVVHWQTAISDWQAPATVRGTFAGQTVSATLSVPWVPQS